MSELCGVVTDIIFQNEENGYVVAQIDDGNDIKTIVGCIPYIAEKQNLKLKGEWTVHPQFGEQFKVEGSEEILPQSSSGIEKYLSSGMIYGIGPVTAKKIVDKFGEKTFDVLDNDIGRLSEVEGIGEKKIKVIAESYSKQKEIKDIMVFLQSYGVTASQCMKIYKKYGMNSIQKVRENPYILVEDISGIGFKTSDKIAMSLGIQKDSPFRIQSGIKYSVSSFCTFGNTYIPLEKLIENSSKMLMVPSKDIEKNIYSCALDQKIKIETIDNRQCVFTMPYYYAEVGTAKKIVSLEACSYGKINVNTEEKITEFEQKERITFSPSQKDAIKGAFENAIEVITGGPGTGKTTIINCIASIFEDAGLNVFMAAPTGRAAKRMTEATNREAKTIHRLLELGYRDEESSYFYRDESSPLECDVVIVDEASMIDIVLMNSLLKAISPGTRLIIVGDANQLPSVGPGNVLKDIIESNLVKVVRLKKIFRQAGGSLITINAHRINDGEMPFLNEKGKDFYFIREPNNSDTLNTLIQLVDRRLPKFNKDWDKSKDIQLVTPTRKGILGVENLNNELQKVLNPPESGKAERKFRNITLRVGDKVMQNKNNYMLEWERVGGTGEREGDGIFNGDIGYICDIDNEENTVSVIFDEERKVVYDTSFLDEIDLAYALTVHKSQGSEFPVVIMPMFVGPPLLMNRNLFYTGITRAKKMVVLVGDIKSVYYMVRNNKSYERYSSLKEKIMNLGKSENNL